MKPFYQSKTIWFNILAVAALVAAQFGFNDFQLDAEVSAGVVAIVNLVLRFVTDKGVLYRIEAV